MLLIANVVMAISLLATLQAAMPSAIDVPEAMAPSPYGIPSTTSNPSGSQVNQESLPLYFLTSNPGKFAEVKALLPNVKLLNYDLPEIQEIDPKQIIFAKLMEAFKYRQGQFIVEDTSLYLDALNGLPGPLIKWFELKLGNVGIVNLVRALGNDKAEAVTYIGYAKNPKDVHFFEGRLRGRIVPLRGDFGFGWDPIFMPEGQTKTLAEMGPELKNSLSMRQQALTKLRDYLASQSQGKETSQ